MTTLAFLRTDALQALFVLVCGALAWRLIWAILVTPRLDRIPPKVERPEPIEEDSRVRVLVREPAPTIEFEPRPQIDLIEVITPAKALPSASRSMVRRVQR